MIDLALSACSDLRLGTPASYADAFVRLASAGKLDAELARRLARAAGLGNLMVHAYDSIDLARLHGAATNGPRDRRVRLSAQPSDFLWTFAKIERSWSPSRTKIVSLGAS